MRTNPFISVIIPVYNAGLYVGQAVESVLDQSYHPLEIIAVDDGSTDSSARVLHSFGNHLRYEHQQNAGPAAARSRGIELARGELLAFLDADDLWAAHKLRTQVEILLDRPEIDILLGQLQYVREAGSSGTPLPAIESLFSPFHAYSFGTSLIKREVFFRVGKLDTAQRYYEDVEWFMRARDYGCRIHQHQDLVYYYRCHEKEKGLNDPEARFDFLSALRKSIHRRRVREE